MLRWRGLDAVPGGWGRSVVTIGPESTKIEATRTASWSKPPPLPRRSRTSPSAP